MIGVIGGGAFGTALAVVLASDGTDVRLWMRRGAQAVNSSRANSAKLPGVVMPEPVLATGDLRDLGTARAVLLVLPAQHTADFLAHHLEQLPDVPLVLCAKGVALDTLELQSELLPKGRQMAVLTGPGFASEIASGLPTALTLASETQDLEVLQNLLSRPALRLYRSDDMIGAQLGGALKNVIAIAAGIAIGAGLGESARASIVTRGFAEMRRLALAMGGQDHTLSGLSGFGDLMLTCASEKSRNFACGLALGRGGVVQAQTTEGIATAQATVALAARHGVQMPIAQAVSQVLAGSWTVRAAMKDLLSRPLRAE